MERDGSDDVPRAALRGTHGENSSDNALHRQPTVSGVVEKETRNDLLLAVKSPEKEGGHRRATTLRFQAKDRK